MIRSSKEPRLLIGVSALALTLSTASLALNVYQMRLAARASAEAARVGPGFAAARPDPGHLLPILMGIGRRLDALERGAPAAVPPGPAGDKASAPDQIAAGRVESQAAQRVNDEPRLVRFTAPRPGVQISQTESGGIAVKNRDPALTGQVMLVNADAEDGSSRQITVVIPPPAS